MLSVSLRYYPTRPYVGPLAVSARLRQSLTASTITSQRYVGAFTETQQFQVGEGLEDRYEQMHQLYSAPQVCEILAISRATLYRLKSAGKIESIKIGSSTRFSDSAIQRFIKASETASRENEVGFQ
jgi:excisionase family DNA binding protein